MMRHLLWLAFAFIILLAAWKLAGLMMDIVLLIILLTVLAVIIKWPSGSK